MADCTRSEVPAGVRILDPEVAVVIDDEEATREEDVGIVDKTCYFVSLLGLAFLWGMSIYCMVLPGGTKASVRSTSLWKVLLFIVRIIICGLIACYDSFLFSSTNFLHTLFNYPLGSTSSKTQLLPSFSSLGLHSASDTSNWEVKKESPRLLIFPTSLCFSVQEVV